MNEETVLLYDQQYWEISNLEIAGGNLYGIFIGGQNSTSLNHFRLTNLDVHGAHFQSVKRGDSGLVFIVSGGTGQVIHDVVVDGVVAHDSTVSEGIFIDAGGAYTGTNGAAQTLGNNITVQNSVAHDVAGDGILIMLLNNGLLQNNVVYNSGLCDNCTGSTPSGLWEWYCHTCIVQFNESYANQSWGGDGGGFDIDYYNNNNVVQYNYGHDSEGYCVSLFGSENTASINNVIRYNICANNAQKSSSAAQGEVFLFTWSGGKINGAQIYNNTFYWNPAGNAPLLVTSGATFAGSNPNFFKNNIIYSTVAGMVQTTSSLALDNNIYWTTAASPSWQYDGTTYTGFASYQSGSGQDAHGYFTDPLLNAPTQHEVGLPSTAFTQQAGSPAHGNGADVCQGISGCTMGARDFFGNALPAQGPFDIGAHQAP